LCFAAFRASLAINRPSLYDPKLQHQPDLIWLMNSAPLRHMIEIDPRRAGANVEAGPFGSS
jgi:hypothetical protein